MVRCLSEGTPPRNCRDFLGTGNDRQPLGSLGCGDNLVEAPLPTERDFVEKTKSGYGHGDGTGIQLLVLGEIDLEGANLFPAQSCRGLAEVACKLRDMV